MGKYHLVQQGEYLAMLAHQYGFVNYRTIWDASENAALKNERKNPNILYPGDELFIPDHEIREDSRPTEKRHTWQKDSQDLKLRIVLTDLKNKPMQGLECVLTVDGDSKEIITGGDGKLPKDIPDNAAGGKLLDKGKPGKELRLQRNFPLKIGHLDPVDKLSGQIARLNNLGYRAFELPDRPFTEEEEKKVGRDPQFLSAVEEFQCDFMGQNNLAVIKQVVDGKCGTNTQAMLKSAHGC